MGLLTPQTTKEEILALYQEVYRLKRAPGEAQCSNNMAEETGIESLEDTKGMPPATGGIAWGPPNQRGKLEDTPPGCLLRQTFHT